MTELERFRRQKDEYFGTSPDSPIEDAGFTGLRYFPEAPELVFDLPLERLAEQQLFELMTSLGDTQPYLRHARISFLVNGQPAALTLFAPAGKDDPEIFFVPFRDATSGVETYAAGRYLDARLQADALVRLDFNYAYNPFCAYSERWRCPLPPFENHLKVAIRAGERTYRRTGADRNGEARG